MQPPLDPDLVLEPVSRRPTVLAPETVDAVLKRPVPVVAGAAHSRPSVSRCVAPGCAPLASIVVVSFNTLAFTRLCLESVLANTRARYELLVIDNGSTDGSREYLAELARLHSCVRFVANEENVGFARANNQALRTAAGELLVLLNSDTIVPPDWLEGLTAHLSEPTVGMVGPVTNQAGNEARIDVEYKTYGEMLRFAQEHTERRRGRVFDIPVLTLFCAAFRRDVYERVGGLDEQFAVGMFEDDDYSVRVRAQGLRVVCAEDVFVHHFGQASFGKLVATGDYAMIFEGNRRRFESKWSLSWSPHRTRHSPAYQRTRIAVRQLVAGHVPAAVGVAVISKGDPRLLDLAGRRCFHFPCDASGGYSGHYPADDADAMEQLQALRPLGVRFLVVPRPSLWWLDYYTELRDYLRPRTIARNEEGVVYRLEPFTVTKSNRFAPTTRAAEVDAATQPGPIPMRTR